MTPASKVELKEPAAPAPAPAPAAPAPAPKQARTPVAPKVAKGTKNGARILLFTAPDGKVEWEKMSPEAQKLFKELFKNPEFLKSFGLTGAAVEAFKPEQCGPLFDAFTMVFQTVCKFLLRFPPAALQCLAYTEQEKAMLAEPTAAVLNRFAPTLLRENKELFVFATVFLTITQRKFLEAKQVAIAEMEKARAAAELKRRGQPTIEVPAVASERSNGAAGEVIPMQPPTATAGDFLGARPATFM